MSASCKKNKAHDKWTTNNNILHMVLFVKFLEDIVGIELAI